MNVISCLGVWSEPDGRLSMSDHLCYCTWSSVYCVHLRGGWPEVGEEGRGRNMEDSGKGLQMLK